MIKNQIKYFAGKTHRIISSYRFSLIYVMVAIGLVVTIVGVLLSIKASGGVRSYSEIEGISVGDHFTFGRYPQGSHGEVQPIEWRVLDIRGGKALVISEKLLDYVEYNNDESSVTWQDCTMCGWLNDNFLNNAFNSGEQKKISTSNVKNHNNSSFGTSGGKDTQNKIFVLSIGEAEKYFSSDSDRKAYTTDFSNPDKSGQEKADCWWLRTPGVDKKHAADVGFDGIINQRGIYVFSSKVAVRPALWLKL